MVNLALALSKTKQSEKTRPLALSKRLNRESSHFSKDKNARMFVMGQIWGVIQVGMRWLQSHEILKVVDDVHEGLMTHLPSLATSWKWPRYELRLLWWPRYELRHLSYDRWTSVGIWGVTDCPLKYEVRDNMMTEVLYQLMTWTKRRRNRSGAAQKTTNSNIMMSALRRAYPMLRTKTDSSMAADQYNADPW